MKVKLNMGDEATVATGAFTAPESGIYNITASSARLYSSYPYGVYDLRGMNQEELVKILNKMEEDFPEVKKANQLRNSKLVKALK